MANKLDIYNCLTVVGKYESACIDRFAGEVQYVEFSKSGFWITEYYGSCQVRYNVHANDEDLTYCSVQTITLIRLWRIYEHLRYCGFDCRFCGTYVQVYN